MYVGSVPQVLSSVQAGTVKPLAVTSETRSKALPDVPTVVEEGLEEAVFDIWWGVFTASGTPPEVVEKINAGINAVMTTPEAEAFLAKQGAMPGAMRAQRCTEPGPAQSAKGGKRATQHNT